MSRRSPQAVAARAPAARGRDLSQLFTYNVSALANTLSRGAAARYSREFGVSLMEWRIIGTLALDAPLSLQQVSRRFDLDKGQASRAVTALLERGIVHRAINGADRRSLMLSLTPAGWRLYRRILASASQRSDRLLGCLRTGERRVFLRCFSRIVAEARAVYYEEKSGARPGAPRGTPAPTVRKPHA